MDRQCTKCGTVKDISDFNKHTRGRDGYAVQCRECAKQATTQWRRANPEKQAESNRRWNEKNREKKAAYMRSWLENNPEAAQKNQEAAKEFAKKVARESGATATNKGKRWTAEEDAILMSPGKSLLEKSKELGRTYGTCGMRRSILRERSQRMEIIAGVQDRISSTNAGT